MQKLSYFLMLSLSNFITIALCLFLFVLFLLWTFPAQYQFSNKYVMSSEISKETHDYDVIKKYIAQGKILPTTTVTDNIIGYYNSLITFLVALLGISAISAYFYIKGTTEDKVEEKVTVGVKRYFESQQFQSEMVKCINTEFRDRLNSLDELENDVEALKQMLPIDTELDEINNSIEG